jgi:hypothetical protein
MWTGFVKWATLGQSFKSGRESKSSRDLQFAKKRWSAGATVTERETVDPCGIVVIRTVESA